MKKSIRNSIARIDVLDGERSVSRGTGFLVTERLVLTALHVVANRRSETLEPYPGEIVLEFPGHRTKARIYETFFDRQADWILLRCVDPPRATPIPLAYLDESQKEWETFGFPDANPRDGMVQTGSVENINADLEGVPVYQLFSKQAGAGDGAPVKGLSGAPVIINDAVVGVLRFALMKEGRTVAGTVYACPVTALNERAGDFLAFQTYETLVGLSKLRRRKHTVWGATTAGVLCLGLVIAATLGFFGRTPQPDKPSGDQAPVASTPKPKPIKVGILNSLSGTLRIGEAGVVTATMLALDEINANGGLLGRPVEYVVKNGQSDPQVFAREAEQLILTDRVCTIFGCWSSASRKACRPVVEQRNHLLIYSLPNEGLEASPNIFHLGSAPNQQIIPAVKWCHQELNAKRYFLVGTESVFARVANEIIKDVLKLLDDNVVGEAYLTSGNTVVADIIQQIRDAQPDVILNTIGGDTNIPFFRELRDAGITSDKIPTFSFSLAENELLTMNREDVAGDYSAWSYFQTADRPANKKFLALLKQRFPAQQVADDPMVTAYAGVHLWAQAVQQAGSDDVAEIRAALAHQSFDGPGGKIEIDPETQYASKPTFIGQIQSNGQFETRWSSEKSERPIPFPMTRSREKWESLLVSLQAGWGGRWQPPARNVQTIKVGVLHSISGTMATSESGVVDATLMAIDELNAKGGVLGRPVESVFADGKSESATFRDEAERLIREEKVCTVFGCWTSASRKTVVPVIEKANNLLIYPVQYEGLEQSPNVFYLGATPNQQILPAVHWCAETLKARRFFLIGSDYIFPRAANELIREEVKLIGGEVVGEEYRPLGNSTFLPTIAKILEAKPDVILNTINGDANVDFFQKLREKGITPDKIPTVSFSIAERGFSAMRIADVVGTYAAWNYFQSVDRPENKRFIKELRAKYYRPLIVTDPMEAAYAGVHLWAQAVEAARSDKPQAIREALRRQTFDGPSGMFQFDPATQHASKTARIGRLQANNQFEIVWSSPAPIPAIVFPPSRTPEQWESFLDDLYKGWGNRWEASATSLSEIRPTTSAPAVDATGSRDIDLLPLIDPAKHSRNGAWRKENGVLISPQSDYQSLALPVTPSKRYRIEIVATRAQGDFNLDLGLVVNGHDVRLVFDGFDERVSGLDSVQGKPPNTPENPTHYAQRIFQNGQPTAITVDVSPTSVLVVCDGKQIVNWSGEAASLTSPLLVTGFKVVPGTLFLGSSSSEFHIRKLRYMPRDETSP